MPTFTYKARSTTGEAVSGTLVAETVSAAARMLDERSLLPVDLTELEDKRKSFLTGSTRRLKLAKVGVMYEQLSDLLKAGVPLLRALSVLSRQAGDSGLARVLREVHDDVAGGDTFADALDKHPHAFPPLHAAMVRAGEKGGFIEDVLSRLSEFVARQDALRNKFIGAMVYPAVLLLGSLGATVFIMTFVVPNIRPVLSGTDLPIVTRFVFAATDLLTEHYLELIGVLVCLIVVVVGFLQSARGKLFLSHAALKTPVIGKVNTMIALCRFCRILGTLLTNGIPILQALKIAKESTGNVLLSDAIDAAAENVRAGEPLTGPLLQSRLFPPAVLDMIAVAEESNTLEKVLIQVADTEEERTARQIDLAMKLLEPVMLLFMGMIVFVMAIGLLLPMLRMATSGMR